MEKTISVFGSSRPGEGTPEYQQAFEIGKHLARAGFTVCNGGYAGIMEASARGAKETGRTTIGVTVDFFPRPANRWIDKEIRAKTMLERLATLVDSADGYVILKGGTGTLLELAYVWEFINKKMIQEKPIVIVGSFWSGVIETLREELLWEGLGDCTKFIQQVETPQECVEFLKKKLL
ncbi:MAG: LOG family protein [Ignavibacteriales bacterium]|nr:LOG family protein [Ignavibacteriales bacterium]